ncbi:hypothetical protein [Pseudomonas huaxiensis]|uniref:hypothetical protein n=1 Tax=Pseudomonas huaxiensis TaxID=2213017 RepID=UPI0013002F54|nr:hypothetical protein [Pseudomonas huaxiensis]
MDYGDIPAWLALVVSASTFFIQHSHQKNSDRRQAERNAQDAQEREDIQRSATEKLTNSNRKLRLEKMIQDLDELLAITLQYWTCSGRDGATSALFMKIKVRDFSSRCTEYRTFLWDRAGEEFSLIRRHITGGQFEVVSRPALATTDPFLSTASRQLSDFRSNIRRVCDKLDSVY